MSKSRIYHSILRINLPKKYSVKQNKPSAVCVLMKNKTNS